jgi:hypothetical protein
MPRARDAAILQQLQGRDRLGGEARERRTGPRRRQPRE